MKAAVEVIIIGRNRIMHPSKIAFFSALSLVSHPLHRKINHHNSILLHNSNQHQNPHYRVNIQFHSKEQKSQQRAERGGRKTA